jgi:hypothetical protein
MNAAELSTSATATVPSTASEAHEQAARGLFQIHTALRRTLDTIIRVSAAPIPDADRTGFAHFCASFNRFLHVHHDGEEEIIFPKLTEVAARAGLPAYASDVTGWRADHKKLLGGLKAFETAAAAFRTGGSRETLQQAATDVRDILYPHLAAEEGELTGAALAKLLSVDEVAALDAASAKHGQQHGGPPVLVLLVYSLTAEEQQAQFGEMPWLVRKLLLKRIWSRGFRASLKYAHNPVIAL